MSLLDHPDAQALPADATLTPAAVAGCRGRLTAFLRRSLPRFYRHVTLSLLALWFLSPERRRRGGEDPGGAGVAGAADHQPLVAGPGAGGGADRRGDHAGAAAERGVADLPLVCGHPDLPATPCAA
jgi:hypothetical protein